MLASCTEMSASELPGMDTVSRPVETLMMDVAVPPTMVCEAAGACSQVLA